MHFFWFFTHLYVSNLQIHKNKLDRSTAFFGIHIYIYIYIYIFLFKLVRRRFAKNENITEIL